MMQDWFKKAKLGIFIHWGLYAVDGVPESWAMSKGEVSFDDYMKQTNGFTAENYDPEEWAKLFKACGARYAVLTTKHHEGFCLFDTAYTDLNVVKATPAHRDLVKPYCDALRQEGLKVGLYFTNTDWADDEHMQVILNKTQDEIEAMHKQKVDFSAMWETGLQANPANEADEKRLQECWQNFMARYKGEMKELLMRHQPDVLWTDVMLERPGFSWESKQVKEMIGTISPNTICNSRLGEYGDYETPEQYIPLKQNDQPWELCTTFNDSWGFQVGDDNYKEVYQLVRLLCECLTKGGNLLISIGPDAKGNIPEKTKQKMLELGAWVHQYEEAIFETQKGLSNDYFLGGSTLSQDKKTLYLFVYDCSCGKVMLNGVRNTAKSITSMKTGNALHARVIGGAPWLNIAGQLWIDLPEAERDDVCTVLKIEFDEEIDIVLPEQEGHSAGEQ